MLTFNENKSILSTKLINFLDYTITYGSLVHKDKATLHQVVGQFSYYSQWIPKFSNDIRPQVVAESFPLNQKLEKAFNDFKSKIEKVSLHSFNEILPPSRNQCYYSNSESGLLPSHLLFSNIYSYKIQTYIC